MSYFTFSGNKLAVTLLAAGALAVGGTGVAAMAVSLPDGAPAVVGETESPSPSPTVTESESPEPSPTETETESPEPTPTETETESPEPAPTETETESPEPAPTGTEEPGSPPASTPVGPDATGPAAVGLCNAYAHGGLGSESTAYQALVNAAGGETSISIYCDTVPAPEDEADEDAPEAPAAGSGEEQVAQQGQDQAPVQKGHAGNQSNNGNKQSGHGQR